jgi:hypothetical protein
MKTLELLVLLIPTLSEAFIESYLEKAKKISVNHFWTAVLRGVFMLGIALTFHLIGIVLWWQAFVFMVALHFAFFNYLYNWLTRNTEGGRKWNYLRDKGIDGMLKVLPWWGLMFFQSIILSTGLMVYYQIWGFRL